MTKKSVGRRIKKARCIRCKYYRELNKTSHICKDCPHRRFKIKR